MDLLHHNVSINYFANHKGMVMNYESMSDFEINKAVAEALGYEIMPRIAYTGKFMEVFPHSIWATRPEHNHRQHYDYCNNASHAWPIITDNRNRIGIKPISIAFIWEAYIPDFNVDEGYTMKYLTQHENPLRAAMIVFLKMQEAV